MSCAPFDLRDFYFEALSQEQQREVKEHLSRCRLCSSELDRMRLTDLALAALPDEEIPRRIGFVSDKVFEPSSVARWWQSLWMSGARLTSASVALLAVAILVYSFRPQPTPVMPLVTSQFAAKSAPDTAAIQTAVDRAVAKAVSATEARYDFKLKQIIAENTRQGLTIERAAETIETMDRRQRVLMVASNRETGPGVGQ